MAGQAVPAADYRWCGPSVFFSVPTTVTTMVFVPPLDAVGHVALARLPAEVAGRLAVDRDPGDAAVPVGRDARR